MRTITIVTQKGGTGKTTLAVSFAVAAMEAGEKVVMFDLDPQGSLVEWSQDRERLGKPPIHVEQFPAHRVADMVQMIASLRGFTLCILDTPGTDNIATHKAMDAASFCLVPIRPAKVDFRGIRPTIRALMTGGTPFAFVLNACATIPNSPRADEMATGLSTMGVLALPQIHNLMDFQDAYSSGQGATEYAPTGKAADEIRQLWQWVNQATKKERAAA